MSDATEIKAITPEALDRVLAELVEQLIASGAARGTSDEFAVARSWLAESLRRHAVPLSDLDSVPGHSAAVLFYTADPRRLELVQVLAEQARTEARFGQLIELLAPDHVPSKATVEQARGNAELRARFLDEFESVLSAELAELVDSRSKNRAALAYNWRSQQRVFSVPVGRDQRFPLFQIDPEAREPKPAIAQVLGALRAAGLDGWQLALWFAGPLASLDDQRPVDLLDTEPEIVVDAARAVASIPH